MSVKCVAVSFTVAVFCSVICVPLSKGLCAVVLGLVCLADDSAVFANYSTV